MKNSQNYMVALYVIRLECKHFSAICFKLEKMACFVSKGKQKKANQMWAKIHFWSVKKTSVR